MEHAGRTANSAPFIGRSPLNRCPDRISRPSNRAKRATIPGPESNYTLCIGPQINEIHFNR
jgi:hypothetical protein